MNRTWVILLRNPLSLLGVILVGIVVFSAIFADFIVPFPEHRGAVVDFANFAHKQIDVLIISNFDRRKDSRIIPMI